MSLRHGVATAHNPFQPVGRPYCHFCHDETDIDVESGFRGATFWYREVCRRCHGVVASGAYGDVPLIDAVDDWLGFAPPTITMEVPNG